MRPKVLVISQHRIFFQIINTMFFSNDNFWKNCKDDHLNYYRRKHQLWLAYLHTFLNTGRNFIINVYLGKHVENCTFLVYKPVQSCVISWCHSLDRLVVYVYYFMIFFDNMKHFLLKNNKENNINVSSKINF